MLTGATGIFLFLFVLAHMLGNLQIFLGPNWLNGYAEHLKNLPLLLWPARVFLLAALAVHMSLALSLAVENRNARPVPYLSKNTVQASPASRAMVVSGIIIFLFIVYHLLHFTFGVTNHSFFNQTDAQGRHDVYSMVVLSYQNILISGVYIFVMGALCMHLGHGLPGFFQSLGLANDKTSPKIRMTGQVLAWTIFLGNSSIPAAVLLGFIKLPGKGV